MKVDVNSFREVNIQMTGDDAARLASVISLVVDRSASQSVDRLYNLLLDHGVLSPGLASIEKNPDREAVEEFGEPEYQVVVL